MELINDILVLLSNPIFILSLKIALALLAALILMQGAKAVVKELWPSRWSPTYRTWVIFIIAYMVGFQTGLYFLDGQYSHKIAAAIGLCNPMVYYGLTQWARAKNRLVLLSLLKMRPIQRNRETGELSLNDTQTFMVNNKNG